MMDIVDQFIVEECTAHVRGLLIDEIAGRSAGSRYFTFNRFNVLIDVDVESATVDDELDPESSCTIPLTAFRARLEQ